MHSSLGNKKSFNKWTKTWSVYENISQWYLNKVYKKKKKKKKEKRKKKKKGGFGLPLLHLTWTIKFNNYTSTFKYFSKLHFSNT